MLWYWIPLFIMSCLTAWMSFLSNQIGGGKWFWMVWAIGLIPWWALLSKISNRLLVDSLIYDVVLTISYTGTLLILGASKNFNFIQWLGFFLTLSGIFLMKSKI
jgi:hypothetical protein